VASIPPHSFVALNDLKVPVKIAQEQLGHGSISTTVYIYRTPSMRRIRGP
jgi:hypothetical protein